MAALYSCLAKWSFAEPTSAAGSLRWHAASATSERQTADFLKFIVADPIRSPCWVTRLESGEERRGLLLHAQSAIELCERLELLSRHLLASGLYQRFGEMQTNVVRLGRQFGGAPEELQAPLAFPRFRENPSQRVHDL